MIVKQYLDSEIYYIENILSEKDLKTLQEFAKNDNDWNSTNALTGKGETTHYERPEVAIKSLNNVIEIKQIYIEMFNNFIIPAEPNLNINMSPTIHRTLSKQTSNPGSTWSMRPHVDERGDSNIKKGLVYYLNDDFEGGEIVYINKKIKHKPIANSMIIHLATEEYEHGVELVNKGTRYFMTNFYRKDDIIIP
jgi:hypothetical protein